MKMTKILSSLAPADDMNHKIHICMKNTKLSTAENEPKPEYIYICVTIPRIARISGQIYSHLIITFSTGKVVVYYWCRMVVSHLTENICILVFPTNISRCPNNTFQNT